MSRPISARYRDPLDEIWLACAHELGFTVVRTAEAYASSTGDGTILVGTADTLDADDSLAQMMLHELCHALVEGEAAHGRRDWGLANEDDRDLLREHACLRLQAHLAAAHGLRQLLAPTTDWRAFYDGLAADPFADPAGRREPSAVAARLGARRAGRAPWAEPLTRALAATRAIAAAVRAHGVGPADGLEPLWARLGPPPAPQHPAGHAPIRPGSERCAACAWRDQRARCLVARKRVADDAPACTSFEPAAELDCQTCAACCTTAYHAVDLGAREPVRKRHPQLVSVDEAGRAQLLRPDGRCVALAGEARYACTVYDDRPRTCRDFTRGSANCLDARRRVGLTL
jgi:hypothetical protein